MMLRLEKIAGGYGRQRVLHNVSLGVDDGGFACVLGSNNAGKSTLINLISGIVGVSNGDVIFNGESVTKLKVHERVQRGLVQVPEGRQLFPQMTVRENLLMGGVGDQQQNRHDEELLEDVHQLFPKLGDRAKQVAGSLSGGEQQMVAIGRGLMSRPKLVMLDEPSLGLAPLVVEAIFDALTELNKRGVTVLLVEQNLTLSLQHAKYAYVLDHGEVTIDGTAESLKDNETVRQAYLGM